MVFENLEVLSPNSRRVFMIKATTKRYFVLSEPPFWGALAMRAKARKAYTFRYGKLYLGSASHVTDRNLSPFPALAIFMPLWTSLSQQSRQPPASNVWPKFRETKNRCFVRPLPIASRSLNPFFFGSTFNLSLVVLCTFFHTLLTLSPFGASIFGL